MLAGQLVLGLQWPLCSCSVCACLQGCVVGVLGGPAPPPNACIASGWSAACKQHACCWIVVLWHATIECMPSLLCACPGVFEVCLFRAQGLPHTPRLFWCCLALPGRGDSACLCVCCRRNSNGISVSSQFGDASGAACFFAPGSTFDQQLTSTPRAQQGRLCSQHMKKNRRTLQGFVRKIPAKAWASSRDCSGSFFVSRGSVCCWRRCGLWESFATCFVGWLAVCCVSGSLVCSVAGVMRGPLQQQQV